MQKAKNAHQKRVIYNIFEFVTKRRKCLWNEFYAKELHAVYFSHLPENCIGYNFSLPVLEA